MKKITISFCSLLGLAVILGLTSCSSEPVPVVKIFANCYLRYTQPAKIAKADIYFAKGTQFENAPLIKMESGVFFHGGDMVARDIPKNGTRYHAIRKGDFSPEYKFSFTPLNQKKIDHSFSMNSLDELSLIGEFSKSKGVEFSWKGKALLQNESIVFLFNNEKNNLVSFEINGPTISSAISFPAEKLNKLPEGKGEIYLVRKQNNISEKSNVTILSSTEFYSDVLRVNILP